MEIKSTKIFKTLSIESIFQLEGKVRSVDVISAYTDIDFINKILDYILENGNKVDKPHFSIHLDYHASGYSSNKDVRTELDKIAKTVKNKFYNKSGVYLVKTGQLFHSKCIISKSRTSINLLIGSINFTDYGFSKNEEMVLSGQALEGGSSYVNRLVNQIWDYIEQIPSEQVGCGEFNIKPLSLRQVLLDGEMYYEQKENDPFGFPLNIPDKILDINQGINRLLSAKINNTISLEHIIFETKELNNLLSSKANSKLSWKKFCIETCYGFWAPTDERENIANVIKEKLKIRSPYYESLFNVINNHKNSIRKQIKQVAQDIEKYVTRKNIRDDNGDSILWSGEETLDAWDDWYDRLEDKLKL